MNTDKIIAESIAKDYAPKDNSKIIALKKLDKKARLPATVFTYTFGIISCLVAGLGMCLAMQVLGGGSGGMIAGIVIGIVGFAGCGVNYPGMHLRIARNSAKFYMSNGKTEAKYLRFYLWISGKILSICSVPSRF